MTPHDAEIDVRVYTGLGRVIRSPAPIDATPGAADHGGRAAAGFTVYRNNVRAAYLRALKDTFPVVERLVGEEFFRYVAHEYFYACPPSSPLVARYGDRIPAFLESFEPAGMLPYLPDVARLELAWLGAYHAAEAISLSPDRILAAAGEAPDRARFTLHPSVRLVRSEFPIHAIWRHNRERPTDAPLLPDGGEIVLLVRPAHKVITSGIPPGAWAALSALAQGQSLGEALDAAALQDSAATPSEIVRLIATSQVVVAVAQEDQEQGAT